MKITFKVDLSDLFRRGIDAATPIVSLNLDPSTMAIEERKLISRHLLPTDDGCDVVYDPERSQEPNEVVQIGQRPGADLVEAENPTVESLLKALTKLGSRKISDSSSTNVIFATVPPSSSGDERLRV